MSKPVVGGRTPENEPESWKAVLTRCSAAEGRLVYAVRTTGVYCRPTCPARRPAPGNVSFFASSSEAESAGYRACLRCRPQLSGTMAGNGPVRHALRFLEDHLGERVTLDRLGQEVGLSAAYLQRTFTSRVGMSPRVYQHARRLQRFRRRVREGFTVNRATFEAGFESSRALYERADDELGMTPGRYRRGGEGLRIRFAATGSPLGEVLVGATSKGVCWVGLGDSSGELERELRLDLPSAELLRDDDGLREWVDAVVKEVAGAPPGGAVPLDLQGTIFQLRVWRKLMEIPLGETRSYGAVAAEIGRPTAARAVASACAKNRVAVLVPCHRVVPVAGGIGGYRWGQERKSALLAREEEPGRAIRPEGQRSGATQKRHKERVRAMGDRRPAHDGDRGD